MLDSSKRVRLLTMLLVISVVLILVLSCTSIAYYEQSENHDAEYKGQYKLVEFVDFSIINMCMEIEMTTNHSYNLTTRYQSGQNAQISFDELSVSCEIIRNMYSPQSEGDQAFWALEHASSATRVACTHLLQKMWRNLTADEPYVDNSAFETNLSEANLAFWSVLDGIGQGFQDRDWQREPYSVVKGMDLENIRTNAEQILNLMSPWVAPW